jgi:hypothetical protein
MLNFDRLYVFEDVKHMFRHGLSQFNIYANPIASKKVRSSYNKLIDLRKHCL